MEETRFQQVSGTFSVPDRTWGCEETFAAMRSKAYSGIKLSSAGLVFKHFGGKVGTRRTSQLDSVMMSLDVGICWNHQIGLSD